MITEITDSDGAMLVCYPDVNVPGNVALYTHFKHKAGGVSLKQSQITILIAALRSAKFAARQLRNSEVHA
jgi:hypothetical protein